MHPDGSESRWPPTRLWPRANRSPHWRRGTLPASAGHLRDCLLLREPAAACCFPLLAFAISPGSGRCFAAALSSPAGESLAVRGFRFVQPRAPPVPTLRGDRPSVHFSANAIVHCGSLALVNQKSLMLFTRFSKASSCTGLTR